MSADRPSATPFDAAREVLARLRRAGHETWLVGGCVRDQLLGKAPETIGEFDIATAALPDEVLRSFRASVPVGRAFGIVRVRCGAHWMEVATFRVGGPGLFERAGTLDSDLAHRDFTINALAWDPESGRIVDPAGGRADIDARVVRAVGDPSDRLEEDPLRAVRAVRFACSGRFRLEEETGRAVRERAARLRDVSPERVRDELLKIAGRAESRRGDAWRALVHLGLAEQVLPLSEAVRAGAEAAAEVIDRLALRTLPGFLAAALREEMPDGAPPKSWRAFAERVVQGLRGPSDEAEVLGGLLAGRARYRALLASDAVRLRLAATRRDRELHEDLLRAEGDAEPVLELLRGEREARGAERPLPLLNGKALIERGIRPGPRLGWLLRKARVLQLSGEAADRAQLLRQLRL